ncbi:hypothetical protein [Paraclostridium dentum]
MSRINIILDIENGRRNFKKVLQGQLVNELIGLYFIVLEIKDIQNLKW